MLPPLGLGAMLPVARRRCIHLIAELGLTSNQSAASRRDAPDSTASTTRSRNSKEHGFGIDPPSKIRINARQIQLSKPAGESRFNSAEIRSSSSASRQVSAQLSSNCSARLFGGIASEGLSCFRAGCISIYAILDRTSTRGAGVVIEAVLANVVVYIFRLFICSSLGSRELHVVGGDAVRNLSIVGIFPVAGSVGARDGIGEAAPI